MVRISTVYDTDINKRVFLVRGDERYARSTSCTVNVGSVSSSNATGFVVPISVNVLRDIGNSTVAVYDNDVLIKTISWSESQSTASTFNSPTLAWNIDHNIRVEYMGNSQCSPSYVDYVIEAKTNPNIYTTTLSFNTITRQIYPSASNTVKVQVTCSSGNINGQSIYFYLDGEELGSATVSSGIATYSYSTEKEGLLNLTAKFNGGANHNGSEVSTTVSSGLITELSGLPNATTINSTATVAGTASTYDSGITANLSSVTYTIYGYVGDTSYSLGTGSFNSSGAFTGKSITLSRAYDNIVLVASKSSKNFPSQKYPIKIYNITSIDLTGSNIAVNGFLNTFNGKINTNGGAVDNVPVVITSSPYSATINKTVYTNTSGEFQIDVFGDGSGDDYIKATVSTDASATYITKQFDYEDLLQYWSRKDKEYNQDYEATNARILKLNNGYKIECVDNHYVGAILIPVGYGDYIVEYDQITGTGMKSRTQIGKVNYTGTTSWTGTHIKYIRKDGVGSFYINNVLEAQTTDEDINFMFGLNLDHNFSYENSSITIDNFKLKANHIDWE